MYKWWISFIIFVLLGALTFLMSMGWSIFAGYVLGIGLMHIGLWKKKLLIILLGLFIIIFSCLVPLFYVGIFQSWNT